MLPGLRFPESAKSTPRSRIDVESRAGFPNAVIVIAVDAREAVFETREVSGRKIEERKDKLPKSQAASADARCSSLLTILTISSLLKRHPPPSFLPGIRPFRAKR